jgi:hypothetical protein
MLKLLVCNNRKCDLENLNKNIEAFLNAFEDAIVYIFHDDDKLKEYAYHPKAKIITLNKNIGLLMARKELIKKLPEEENTDTCTWLDSDDILNIGNLKKYYNEFINSNWELYGSLRETMVWNKLYKQELLKKIYNNIPQENYGFNNVVFEDGFAMTSLLYIKEKEGITLNNTKLDLIRYNGMHPYFEINNKFYAVKNFSSLVLRYVWSLDRSTVFYEKDATLPTMLFCDYCKKYGFEYIIGILKELAKKCKKYKPYVEYQIAKIEKAYKDSLD